MIAPLAKQHYSSNSYNTTALTLMVHSILEPRCSEILNVLVGYPCFLDCTLQGWMSTGKENALHKDVNVVDRVTRVKRSLKLSLVTTLDMYCH